MDSSIPYPLHQFDPLKDGLRNLHQEHTSGHAVEEMQKVQHSQGFKKSLKNMQQMYGLALPAKIQIEAQIVNRTRLGLPSSNLALDTLLGRLDDFSTESYLGLPDNSCELVDYREVIEQQRGVVTCLPRRM